MQKKKKIVIAGIANILHHKSWTITEDGTTSARVDGMLRSQNRWGRENSKTQPFGQVLRNMTGVAISKVVHSRNVWLPLR